MNVDQLRGRFRLATGRIKELTGRLVGNRTVMTRGTAESTLGKAIAQFGDAKEAVIRRILASQREQSGAR